MDAPKEGNLLPHKEAPLFLSSFTGENPQNTALKPSCVLALHYRSAPGGKPQDLELTPGDPWHNEFTAILDLTDPVVELGADKVCLVAPLTTAH